MGTSVSIGLTQKAIQAIGCHVETIGTAIPFSI